MIQHLPLDSAWYRERRGPFTGSDHLVREVESRLRDLLVVQNAQLAALRAGLHITGGDSLPTPKYIDLPGPAREVDEQEEQLRELERAQLSALMHRN